MRAGRDGIFSNHAAAAAAACNLHRALGLGLRWRHSRQEPDSEMGAGQRAERCGEIM